MCRGHSFIYKMKISKYTPRCSAWKLPYEKLRLVAITILALFVASCASSRTEKHSTKAKLGRTQSDSTAQQSRLLTIATTSYQKIAADTASMAIPLESLRSRSTDFARYARSGRAHLEVKVRDSIVYVDASCDSLQRLVQTYAAQVDYYRHQAASQQSVKQEVTQQVKKHPSQSPLTLPLLLVMGVAIIVAARSK